LGLSFKGHFTNPKMRGFDTTCSDLDFDRTYLESIKKFYLRRTISKFATQWQRVCKQEKRRRMERECLNSL